jgi:hypothetical protein
MLPIVIGPSVPLRAERAGGLFPGARTASRADPRWVSAPRAGQFVVRGAGLGGWGEGCCLGIDGCGGPWPAGARRLRRSRRTAMAKG